MSLNIIMQALTSIGYEPMYPFNPAQCLNATVVDTTTSSQYNLLLAGVIIPITSTIGNSLGIISFLPTISNSANATLSINGDTALPIKMADGSNIGAGIFTVNQPVFLKYYNNAFVLLLSKASVGLGNVDNTSDMNKPISNAVQTALNSKLSTPALIPANSNLNNYQTAGMYYCDNNASIPTIANLPLQTTFCLLVEKFDGVSQTCTFNPAFSGAGASVFMRRYWGGTWTTWTQQAYILSGTGVPSSSQGLNGNIYIKYS